MTQPEHAPATPKQPVAPLGRARDLAETILNTVRLARALAGAGRKVDLAGLDGPIGLLCAKSLDLPPEEGHQMRVALIGILQEIDALSAILGALPESPIPDSPMRDDGPPPDRR